MTIRSFDSPEEMIKAMQADEDAAAAAVKPWQKVLTEGDHFIRVAHGIVIYGYLAKDDEDMLPFYHFSRCFSPYCPDGEYGEIHASTFASPMSAGQFEAAREAGWPQEIEAVEAIMNLNSQGRKA